jgi:hypothetical protein
MRAEVIIACRGEVPQNLARTIAGLHLGLDDGVCVVFDGERQPEYNLPAHVRVERPWTDPRGCGQARHHGITTSTATYVVLIDGHMEFTAGWLDTICDHLRRHKRDVTCAHMQSLGHDWKPLAGQIYSGAYIALRCHEDGNQFWALAAKWNRGPAIESGRIGAAMGACYGMRRAWYRGMGEPLRILQAWGGDEEMLALCTYICGGQTYLLPITAGHIYAAPRLMRIGSGVEDCRVWANRLAVLRSLPGDHADLEAWAHKCGLPWVQIEREYDRVRPQVAELRDHLSRQKRTFEDMIAAGLACELTDEQREVERQRPRVAADQARAKTAPKTVVAPPPAPVVPVIPRACPACSNIDTLHRYSSGNKFEAAIGPVLKCSRCGHKVRRAA